MSRPRVLMVTGAYFPELAGGSLQCRTLVLALRDRVTFSVFTTTGDGDQPVESEVDGIPVYRVFVDPRRAPSKIAGAAAMLALLPRIVRGADIFHFHGFTEKMLLLLAAAKLSGRRTVEKMTSVGWDDPVSIRTRRFGRLLSAGISSVDRIVAVSPAMREKCRLAGLADDVVEMIPNGVDTVRFAPADATARERFRASLGVPANACLVTFVGFWSPEKGPDVLFEAWRLARERSGVDAWLLYIGSTAADHGEVDAALVADVKRLVEQHGLGSRVLFVERTNEIETYLQASDVFALPSSREGLSNALLEAMATGLPPVVAGIPGVSDSVVDSGVNGYIVPAGDASALADPLTLLLGDGRRREQMGGRARDTIVARFSIDAIADRYFSMYSKLAARRPAGA